MTPPKLSRSRHFCFGCKAQRVVHPAIERLHGFHKREDLILKLDQLLDVSLLCCRNHWSEALTDQSRLDKVLAKVLEDGDVGHVAVCAAITLPAVAVRTDPEHREASSATSLPKINFARMIRGVARWERLTWKRLQVDRISNRYYASANISACRVVVGFQEHMAFMHHISLGCRTTCCC